MEPLPWMSELLIRKPELQGLRDRLAELEAQASGGEKGGCGSGQARCTCGGCSDPSRLISHVWAGALGAVHCLAAAWSRRQRCLHRAVPADGWERIAT